MAVFCELKVKKLCLFENELFYFKKKYIME